MAQIHSVIVIHTTSGRSNAQTDALFRLILRHVSGKEVSLDFPTLPHNEREKGRTDQYVFDLTQLQEAFDSAALGAAQIGVSILGGDAWLPSSIFVIGLPFSGSPILLVGQPSWPSDQWFSTQASDAGGTAKKTRFLNEGLEIPL